MRDMLGIADRGMVFDLLERVLRGDAAAALSQLDQLYRGGADPLVVLQDLLELSHFLTRLKLAPEAGGGSDCGRRPRACAPAYREAVDAGAGARLANAAERDRGGADGAFGNTSCGNGARAPCLCRRSAGTRRACARNRGAGEFLAWSRQRYGGPDPTDPPAPRCSKPIPAGRRRNIADRRRRAPHRIQSDDRASISARSGIEVWAGQDPVPQSFDEVIALFDKRREALIRSHLWAHLHLVHLSRPIEFRPGRMRRGSRQPARPAVERVDRNPLAYSGFRSRGRAEPARAGGATRRDLRNEVAGHPLVQAVLETFPGATISAVRERFARRRPEEILSEDPEDAEGTGEDET